MGLKHFIGRAAFYWAYRKCNFAFHYSTKFYAILSKTPCGLSPPSPVPFRTILLESPAAEQRKNGPPNLRKSTSGLLAPSCVWKPIWPFLAGPGRAKLEPRWAQKAPRGAKLRPHWRDLAAKRRQEAPKRSYLASRWEILGKSGGHFWDI